MSKQPCRHGFVAVQRCQGMRGPSVRAPPMDIGAMAHQQLNHRDIPTLRRDMQRGVAMLTPGKIHVRAVLHQPAQAGASLGYATLWTAWVTFPLMAAVQLVCRRKAPLPAKRDGAKARTNTPAPQSPGLSARP